MSTNLSPLHIVPVPSGRQFVWPVPGSKSITNRALVLAALAEGTTRLSGVLESDDTRYMRLALEAMGVSVALGKAPDELVIEGGLSRLVPATQPIFVGNSGTTVRFLAALAALVPGRTTLVGDEHMAKRPIADLVDGLRQLGVGVTCATGCPPLTIEGGTLTGDSVCMRGDRSSQYFTALLLVGGLTGKCVRIEVQGELVSRPYVDMTIRMLRAFGAEIENEGTGFLVHPVGGYTPIEYAIEPDASAASYPFALAAAGGHDITVANLGPSSLQGDYTFVDVLEKMGARVQRSHAGTRVRGLGGLKAIDVDMHHISDTVMTLAAIAPLATATTIRNVANIRIKETDRLLATANELRRLGQQVTMGEDWLQIEPRPIQPAMVHCYSDHRIAMSFAVLGAVKPGVDIMDPACVAKTYPQFWRDLQSFRGESEPKLPRQQG